MDKSSLVGLERGGIFDFFSIKGWGGGGGGGNEI